MTLNEVERRSGLFQSSIRFYASEGLLSTSGQDDYSEQDLQTLQRIHLLRSLYVSLEEIKALQSGADQLADVLRRQMEQWASGKTDRQRHRQICQEILAEGAAYDTLDAQQYLPQLEQPLPPAALENNSDRVQAPWRRFFARTLDMALYTVLWIALLVLLGFHINFLDQGVIISYLKTLVSLVLMVFLEPLFLSKLGTTPGKAILGLRVTDLSGQRLTYRAAAARTGTVISRGMGFEIPIYNLVRYYKSASACGRGEVLPWETKSQLSLRTNKVPLRVLGVAATYCAVVALLVVFALVGRLPDHRGDITVAQFCENYNQMAGYYGVSTKRLNPDGSWMEPPQTNDDTYALDDLLSPPRQLTFTETDGVMTGMQMLVFKEEGSLLTDIGQTEMMLAIQAFVCAQENYDLFSDSISELTNYIAANALCPFDETLFGVKLTCQVDQENVADFFSEKDPSESQEAGGQDVLLSFTMEKTK